MINIKNYINEYLNNDKIMAWYKINNNIKLEEKFSYKNVRNTFLNSVKNRFQYKINEVNENLTLVESIIQTNQLINEKYYDIIINATVSDNNMYGNCDLLVKGSLLNKNKNNYKLNNDLYYPLFICTFFNKKDINKYINLDIYKKLGEEYLRLLNLNQNEPVNYYIICPEHRWYGNEILIYNNYSNFDLNFKNWIDEIFNLKYNDLLDIRKIKPYYKYDINNFEKNLLIQRKDVRLLCGIGPKITKLLYNTYNIYSWNDNNFIPTIKKILSVKKYNFIKNIIEFSKKKKEIQFSPSFNYELYKNNKITFFVDFETFGKKKMQGGIDMLYLIGLYSVINDNSKTKRFHYFMTQKKDLNEEKNIIEQWINCMLKYKQIYSNDKNKIKIYHWGHMERSYFNKVLLRQNNYMKDIFFNNFEFVDLCNILKVNEFIFTDFISGYSIKDISKILYKNKKIPISYNEIECKNGYDSFDLGIQYYNGNLECRNKIIEYNKVDCMTIYYILKYILETLDKN
jgi:hypothetical protein